MDSDTSVEGDAVLESSFASRLFQPGNDRLGYILFLGSLILWAEGEKSSLSKCHPGNHRSILVSSKPVSKNKIIHKERERPAKGKSEKKTQIIVIDYRSISCSYGSCNNNNTVNFSEDFGGDAPEYDSPNYNDGVFENVETTTLSNDETSTWDTLSQYMVSDNCRSPDEFCLHRVQVEGLRRWPVQCILVRSLNCFVAHK